MSEVEKHSQFHKRNKHRDSYDFQVLTKAYPELQSFVTNNPNGEKTIDFSDSKAVLSLNKALLKQFYHVDNWMIPEGYLCPPIPGRADYVHYVSDLLEEMNGNSVPKGKRVNILDIGTGANCVYPIIGSQEYGWKFTATEIDPLSLKVARLIVQSNGSLSKNIKIVQQKQKQFIFHRILNDKDRFDLSICNPPFHESKKAAVDANVKKWSKLKKDSDLDETNLNFGGMENELWYPGGESAFIKRMIKESSDYKTQVCWFTSLVSKKDNLKGLEKSLKEYRVEDYRIINMNQGHKQSRLIAWTYLSKIERGDWAEKYWK